MARSDPTSIFDPVEWLICGESERCSSFMMLLAGQTHWHSISIDFAPGRRHSSTRSFGRASHWDSAWGIAPARPP